MREDQGRKEDALQIDVFSTSQISVSTQAWATKDGTTSPSPPTCCPFNCSKLIVDGDE